MATRDYKESGAPDVASLATTEPIKEGSYLGALFKDRYLIESKLGQGGLGAVYLARDQQLHSKPVVVKVLLDEPGQDEWFKKKFRQEVEALSRIDHPGVVGILDWGQTPDSKQFLVMQFVKGRSLRSLIKAEGMEFDEVAQIMRQTAQALSAAHDQGVLHCDLKPENIMLQDLGEGAYQVKIVDFGIAKIRDSQISSTSSETKVAGTLHYMAPEQLKGRPSTASDIFALGVIAYEMLTGRRPFNPPNQYQALETLRAGVRIKPQYLRLNLPLEAQEVVLKALFFDAGERYMRARDFGELLAQALTTDLELPTRAASDEGADLEMAHVLFMDIVGYSKLPTDQQTQIVRQLQQIVGGTDTFQRAKSSKQLINRSTGDGMALVFFSGPKAPAECAIEIARALRAQPHIGLRMGINSGPVYRVKDMNETVDVAGAGINMAQRVMDCGDAGHILLSKSIADVLKELGEWRERVHDLGKYKVKHGVSVQLSNLYAGGIGNPKLPAKLRKRQMSLVAMAAVAVIITAAIIAALIFSGRSNSASSGGASGAATAQPTHSVSKDAYSAYLEARRALGRDDPPDNYRDAARYFEEAVRIDSNYALAYAGLAQAYANLGEWSGVQSLITPEDAFERAKSAAQQAIALDGTLAEAHTSLGIVYQDIWDFSDADIEFKQATEINTKDAMAHQSYGAFLANMGRFEEAQKELELARSLEPLNLTTLAFIGRTHYYNRDYHQAITQYKNILDRYPHFHLARGLLGQAYEAKGERIKAIEQYREINPNNDSADALLQLAHIYALKGERDKTIAALSEYEKRSGSAFAIALVYLDVGDKEKAIEWLQKAYDDHTVSMVLLKVEPLLDSLRSEPRDTRFERLMRGLGFVD
jgi:serine/threonine protein kinase/Tfp pilus assembly protein PilF